MCQIRLTDPQIGTTPPQDDTIGAPTAPSQAEAHPLLKHDQAQREQHVLGKYPGHHFLPRLHPSQRHKVEARHSQRLFSSLHQKPCKQHQGSLTSDTNMVTYFGCTWSHVHEARWNHEANLRLRGSEGCVSMYAPASLRSACFMVWFMACFMVRP